MCSFPSFSIRRLTRALLALCLISTSGLAATFPVPEAPTNVPAADRIPRPPSREGSNRNIITPDFEDGGWRTFLGDLHVHARGHAAKSGELTPQINRSEVYESARLFGFDFLGITNHKTSWDLLDDDPAPISKHSPDTDERGQPNLVMLKGVESHLGPLDSGNNHPYHFNSFNKLIHLNTTPITALHDQILWNYSPDPLDSTHVQLNHPDGPDVWFTLPSGMEQRRKVRDAIELVEYKGDDSFFELLRRGFRVAPVSNSDTHAVFRGQNDPRQYLPEPGVPLEKVTPGDDMSQGRTGIVLPPSMPFSYANFLRALRNRWVFRTTLPGASGFFKANGHVMGSEFSLQAQERRLDWSVYGTTLNGLGGGRNEWKHLEIWSPFQPQAPLKRLTYLDPELVNLKEDFSLTPYESIYVVKLIQGGPGAEVILAPIWITNPRPRPIVSFNTGAYVSRGTTPCLKVSGGGDHMQVQRATFQGGKRGWQTVGTAAEYACYPINTTHLPASSEWRVIDRYQPEVASNSAVLTVYDALEVTVPTPAESPSEGRPLTLQWKSTRPERVAYQVSNDGGSTWSPLGAESVEYVSQQVSFPTQGWGNLDVMLKVVSLNHPGFHGATAPIHIQGTEDRLENHEVVPLGPVMLDWKPATGEYRVWKVDLGTPAPLLPGHVTMSNVWPSLAGGHRLIDVGGDRMLDWEPSSGHYRVWQIDRANPIDLLPGQPLLESTWGSIRTGHQLIYLDQNQLLDWEPATGHYRLWQVDRGNSVDLLPGQPLLESTWGSIREDHQLIYIGGNQVLDWQPATGDYRVWQMDRTNSVDLLPGQPVLVGAWGSIRTGHRLSYLGHDYLLDWEPSSGNYRVWRIDRTNSVDLLPGSPVVESNAAAIPW